MVFNYSKEALAGGGKPSLSYRGGWGDEKGWHPILGWRHNFEPTPGGGGGGGCSEIQEAPTNPSTRPPNKCSCTALPWSEAMNGPSSPVPFAQMMLSCNVFVFSVCFAEVGDWLMLWYMRRQGGGFVEHTQAYRTLKQWTSNFCSHYDSNGGMNMAA